MFYCRPRTYRNLQSVGKVSLYLICMSYRQVGTLATHLAKGTFYPHPRRCGGGVAGSLFNGQWSKTWATFLAVQIEKSPRARYFKDVEAQESGNHDRLIKRTSNRVVPTASTASTAPNAPVAPSEPGEPIATGSRTQKKTLQCAPTMEKSWHRGRTDFIQTNANRQRGNVLRTFPYQQGLLRHVTAKNRGSAGQKVYSLENTDCTGRTISSLPTVSLCTVHCFL